MGRPKRIKCIPIGIWTFNNKTWYRLCPYCGSEVVHKSWQSVWNSHKQKRGCKCKSAWMKGLTKETDERIKNMSEKQSKIMKEKFKCGELQIWNKGLTKETSKIIAAYAERHRGYKHSIKSKRKISEASKEHWNNVEYRNKVIKNVSIGVRKSYASGKRKVPINFDTKPELAVESVLKKIKIKYYKQYPIWASYPRTYRYVRFYDFYLPKYKLLIEVNGDYWHGYNLKYEDCNKIQRDAKYNDSLKLKIALDNLLNIEYIWEHETKNEGNLYEKISKILHPTNKLAKRLAIKSVY